LASRDEFAFVKFAFHQNAILELTTAAGIIQDELAPLKLAFDKATPHERRPTKFTPCESGLRNQRPVEQAPIPIDFLEPATDQCAVKSTPFDLQTDEGTIQKNLIIFSGGWKSSLDTEILPVDQQGAYTPKASEVIEFLLHNIKTRIIARGRERGGDVFKPCFIPHSKFHPFVMGNVNPNVIGIRHQTKIPPRNHRDLNEIYQIVRFAVVEEQSWRIGELLAIAIALS
jgi:hypothetical protein